MANTLRFKRGLVATIPTALAGEPLFTTDTFDLYIGNGTNNTRFQKYIASGTTSQLLRGDGSLLTMPIVLTSPATGQVLKFNGTNWVNDSDAGITGSLTTNYLPKATGATTLGNSLVFDNGTNVLVNTTTALWSAAGRQTFEINGGSQSLLGLNVGNSTAGYLWHSGTYLSLANVRNSWLSFVTNSSEVARFHATGNFGINTGATDSGQRLQVSGTALITGATTIGGNLTVDTNVLFVDATDNEVGIGTTNPLYTFHTISGNTTIGAFRQSGAALGQLLVGNTAADLIIRILASGDALIASDTSKYLALGTSGTERMRLDASGNLGLGVTPSAWGSTWRAIDLENSSGGQAIAALYPMIIANGYNTGGGFFYKTTSQATYYQQIVGQHRWFNAPSGTAGNAITFTQAMTLDASGNLAVGIATASSRLHVNAAAGAAHIRISEAGTTRGFIGGANGIVTSRNGYFMVRGEAGLILSGNGNNSDIIINPTTANVQIGGTSDTGEKLQVTGTAKITGATTFGSDITLSPTGNSTITQNASTGNYNQILFRVNSVTQSSILALGNSLYFSIDGSSTQLTLLTGGNVGIGTATPTAKLHVSGNAIVTGTIAVGGTATFLNPSSVNIVGTATLVGTTARNTSSASGNTQCGFYLENGTSNGQLYKAGTGYTTLKTIAANDLGFYNAAAGNISILNDFASGSIILTAGGSSTAQWTIGANGDLTAADGENIIVGSTNGTKIGTAATQKIGFWNATPIVQPNNSVAAANYVAGIGSAVTTLDAFDGYTIGQVVKALRNAGILS
jgi:hypothetical protein